MKTIKFVIAIVCALAINMSIYAQKKDLSTTNSDLKTETIKVWGNCGMCKVRIEKAANVHGVSKATWDAATGILTINYDPSKVKIEDIQKKLAEVGHDTEQYKADDKVYDALPGCCKYQRRK